MSVFYHEKMDLYHKALAFSCAVDAIVLELPRERFYLKNQLWRCSSSIPFNIAEGTAGQSEATRLNYFRIARGSAAECSAIFDYINGLQLLPTEKLLYGSVRELGALLGSSIYKHLK